MEDATLIKVLSLIKVCLCYLMIGKEGYCHSIITEIEELINGVGKEKEV